MLCRRALEIWEHADDVPASSAHALLTLADVARLRGEHDQAIALYDDALEDLQAAGDQRCTASTYKNLATIAAASGEHDSAAGLFRRSLRLRHDLGDDAGLAECFEGLAGVDLASGQAETAVELLGAAAVLREHPARRRQPGRPMPSPPCCAPRAPGSVRVVRRDLQAWRRAIGPGRRRARPRHNPDHLAADQLAGSDSLRQRFTEVIATLPVTSSAWKGLPGGDGRADLPLSC